MNLLIPYVPLINHPDPTLEEFTYGYAGSRGHKLKTTLRKGDYVFFHTSLNHKKYVTAYYVVDRVLNTSEAATDQNIFLKYKNPHITEYREGKRTNGIDAIVFGDPILSRKLERPLPFDRSLAKKLSLSIKFRKGVANSQCIGSATRQWRKLCSEDVAVLLTEIKKNERTGLAVQKTLSTDEVTEIIEKDLERFIAANPKILGESLKLMGRQLQTPVGRIDLLFENENKTMIVVELKLNRIGREALNQLRRYMHHVEKEMETDLEGVIVCKGVMPAFEEEFRNLKKIKILRYGWTLEISGI